MSQIFRIGIHARTRGKSSRQLLVPTPLTNAIATLVFATATASPGLVCAQSVTGIGMSPAPDGSSDWSVNGSTLFIGSLGGTGALNIDGGGTVSGVNQTQIGVNGGTGTVTVSGSDGNGHVSKLSSSSNTAVGLDGIGTLIISGGGRVNGGEGDIGREGGDPNAANGVVTVSGRDSAGNASTWTNSSVFLGLGGGTGTLTIENGGEVITDSFVRMGDTGTSVATLHLNGDINARGVLETRSVNRLNGTVTLDLNGGILRAKEDQTNFLNGFSALTLGAGGAWFDTNGFNIAVGTAFDGTAAGVNKLGAGTLTLSGNSTYTGDTTINGGTIRISSDGNLGAAAGGLLFGSGTLNTTANITSHRIVTIGGTGTFLTDASTTLTLTGGLSGSGTLVKDGPGLLVLTGDARHTGGTTISGGTLQIGDGGMLGSVAGNVTDNGTLTFFRSDDVIFDGLVSGNGSLTMNGSGTLTLTGSSTYSGTTTIHSGRLLVNGDQSAATGLTTVEAGATLGGGGIIGGDVDVVGNGILAPGNSPGTLTIKGQLQLANTSILNYEFGKPNVPGGPLNDLVNIGGNLRLDGVINVDVSSGSTLGPGIYRIFNYGGTLTDNTLNPGSMPTGSNLVVQTAIAHQVNLVNMAGLDLNFWDGDVGPKTDAVVNGGNGTWHMAGTDNNWTELTGSVNEPYQSNSFAIFGGAAGTVTVDNNLGAVSVSGMQFAADGYLIRGGDIALTGPQSTIAVGDGTAPGANYTATIASRLTGSSELVKTDLGTLVLTAANSYTGATSVMGGTLVVNGSIANSAVSVHNSATLSGSGVVGATTVASGGTIAPGNGIGTLSVNGNYMQQAGSIYRVDLNPTSSGADRIIVSGAADLANGATVNVVKTINAPYTTNTRYTILTAAGEVHGTFSLTGDIDLTAFIHLTGDYDANNAYLVTSQSRSINSVGGSPNQIATGEAIDGFPDTNPVKTAVLNLPDVAVARNALSQLSGDIHSSVKTTMLDNGHFVRDAATDRIREAFCSVATRAKTREQETDVHGKRESPADCDITPDRLSTWGQVFGSWGHMDTDGNAIGVDRSISGFITGADAPVSDNWRLGVLGGYGSSSTRADTINSSATTDEYYLGVYGGAQWGPLGFRTGVTYTRQNISTRRSVNFTGFSDSLLADYHAGMTQVFGDLGYRFDRGQIMLEPFANLAYASLDTDGFTERGGAAALSGTKNTTKTGFATLGLRAATDFSVGSVAVQGRGSIGWIHAFAHTTPISTLAFDDGSQFEIAGLPIARDAAVINLGLDFNIGSNAVLGLSYGGQISDNAIDQSVRGTFTVSF